jgi:malonate decarboxylase delta subunit
MSDIPAGLETLDFSYAGGRAAGAFAPVLVGVVGSGNLEVMLESTPNDDCSVRVQTSARGFAPIWQAVMDDFHTRHGLAGLRVSINDMGATPAVVSLRLDQAVAELPNGAQP